MTNSSRITPVTAMITFLPINERTRGGVAGAGAAAGGGRDGGKAGSGTICVNGAAARLVQAGDPVIIISYAQMTPQEAQRHRPTIVLLNPDNTIRDTLRGGPESDLAILSESL